MVLFFGCVMLASCGGKNTLSDDDLLRYGRSSYSKAGMMFKEIQLGLHHNIPVKVSFPCGDICPDYTTRIIYYDVDIVKCEENGGVVSEVAVPVSIAMEKKSFCIPKVLADAHIL